MQQNDANAKRHQSMGKCLDCEIQVDVNHFRKVHGILISQLGQSQGGGHGKPSMYKCKLCKPETPPRRLPNMTPQELYNHALVHHDDDAMIKNRLRAKKSQVNGSQNGDASHLLKDDIPGYTRITNEQLNIFGDLHLDNKRLRDDLTKAKEKIAYLEEELKKKATPQSDSAKQLILDTSGKNTAGQK